MPWAGVDQTQNEGLGRAIPTLAYSEASGRQQHLQLIHITATPYPAITWAGTAMSSPGSYQDLSPGSPQSIHY